MSLTVYISTPWIWALVISNNKVRWGQWSKYNSKCSWSFINPFSMAKTRYKQVQSKFPLGAEEIWKPKLLLDGGEAQLSYWSKCWHLSAFWSTKLCTLCCNILEFRTIFSSIQLWKNIHTLMSMVVIYSTLKDEIMFFGFPSLQNCYFSTTANGTHLTDHWIRITKAIPLVKYIFFVNTYTTFLQHVMHYS